MNEASTLLLHPSLDAKTKGVPLTQARLTDQQRLALTLQGAALLAHFDHAGLFLARGWETAETGEGTILQVSSVEIGKCPIAQQAVLLDLLKRMFPSRDERGEITGRGAARRIARQLQRSWKQLLFPLSPDDAVAQILSLAPFLWQSTFREARVALLAVHQNEDTKRSWVAGPGRHRRRILKRSADPHKIADLLRSSEAREVWDGFREDADPRALAAEGRFHQAVSYWRRRPPRGRSDVLLYARSLFALGLFSQANEVLKRRTSFAARYLRLRCLAELGKHDAAIQLIFRLDKESPDASEMIDLADAAVRAAAKKGDFAWSRDWVSRARKAAAGRPRLELRAELLAAEAAWDEGRWKDMTRHLMRARPALRDPALRRRWYEVRSLLAVGRKDGAAVVENSTLVLHDRRRMTPTEAGRRFNDLAYGRLLLGDLAGAERGVRHALRLLNTTESSSRNTLGLSNLAGIRLRRGCFEGVVEALEASTEENRQTRNFRGQVGDLELWVRHELAQGRPEAALFRIGEARELIAEHEVGYYEIFDLFAARAYGWLGRPERAAACLSRVPESIFLELEPEERPAVWALAKRLDRAAREAFATPWAELWSAYAAGIHPKSNVWETLDSLERFRAARLVFDCLMVLPESVPPIRIRNAIESFRSIGAVRFADRLERSFFSPWQAVERYLESEKISKEGIEALFESAGYPETRLAMTEMGEEILLKGGAGGQQILNVALGRERLVLSAPSMDPILRSLFRLVRRDALSLAPIPRKKQRSRPPIRGMVGENPAFLKTLTKLDLLANSDLPIVIFGETGTGKELMARRVHEQSPRGSGPYFAQNCAALPNENLLQAKLFGYVRGAFTGADRDQKGIFEQANKGTVFLDEIGDLPLTVQGTLLRVLQEGEICRLGDHFARKVDIRLVAATHKDLREMVRSGDFRQDLYFRLRGGTLLLPPLRDRGDDVLLLAEFLLEQYWKSLEGREEKRPVLSSGARARLQKHSWPGNVRELKQAVHHAVIMARDRPIVAEDLDLQEEERGDTGDYRQRVDRYRRKILSEAIAKTGGNLAAAARRLGLTRQALSYLVRQLGLT